MSSPTHVLGFRLCLNVQDPYAVKLHEAVRSQLKLVDVHPSWKLDVFRFMLNFESNSQEVQNLYLAVTDLHQELKLYVAEELNRLNVKIASGDACLVSKGKMFVWGPDFPSHLTLVVSMTGEGRSLLTEIRKKCCGYVGEWMGRDPNRFCKTLGWNISFDAGAVFSRIGAPLDKGDEMYLDLGILPLRAKCCLIRGCNYSCSDQYDKSERSGENYNTMLKCIYSHEPPQMCTNALECAMPRMKYAWKDKLAAFNMITKEELPKDERELCRMTTDMVVGDLSSVLARCDMGEGATISLAEPPMQFEAYNCSCYSDKA